MQRGTQDVEVDLLGSLRIRTAYGACVVNSARLRSVLAVLTLQVGAVVGVDELIDELWGRNPPNKARNALQASIARLRRMIDVGLAVELPQEVIRTVGNGYVLDLPEEAVDANCFVDLAKRGMALLPDAPDKAGEVLFDALKLWRGPALFDAGEGLERQAAAARLEEWRLTAQEDLIAAQLAVGHHREVLSELKALVAQHPERERVSELLMVSLYMSGRQTEALQEFHHARKWLRDEYGLQPGPSLNALHQALLERVNDVERLLWNRAAGSTSVLVDAAGSRRQ